jgi:branched-chain amino acid transport system permease protein
MPEARRKLPVPLWAIGLVALLAYPLFPVLDKLVGGAFGLHLGLDRHLVTVFVFAILALGLNLQAGYAGLLQLGITAFLAIGAYTAGLVVVGKYPFQLGVWGALALAPVIAGLAGLALGAPTIRLRGDYLAIVTLGFGEVVRVVLLNYENITDGPRGLNPLPDPWLPSLIKAPFAEGDTERRLHFLTMYYLALGILVGLVILLRALERSRLGRAFVALREDELATSCMGFEPGRIKLIAFALGAAIAGLAGALYATNLTTTADPNTYDFNFSIMVLCAVIIGGLGSLRGALLGAAVLIGFDSVLSPLITSLIQKATGGDSTSVFLTFTNWRWLIFGVALILMMRLRPEGLWPSSRMKEELHERHGQEGVS